ncbi:Rho GTPase activation protein with PH domain-containing protein [Perilla frutescens var. frutescens]|nr:Rho GTPase activation protein with PH domain-containing protein [Perilla frutescens var. frutescens]
MASKAETDESRCFWASTRAMGSLSLSEPSSDDAGVVDIKSAAMISGRDSSFSLYASATSSDESCDLLGRALSNGSETKKIIEQLILKENFSRMSNTSTRAPNLNCFKNLVNVILNTKLLQRSPQMLLCNVSIIFRFKIVAFCQLYYFVSTMKRTHDGGGQVFQLELDGAAKAIRVVAAAVELRVQPVSVVCHFFITSFQFGGIDLNSSGSVVVKEDKKLLTVLFPDGRDGRAFTLKAETLEDLHEWKTALEEALSNAPNAALVTGQNGMFKNDQLNAGNASSDQVKDRQTAKSLVIGRPILLALEEMALHPSWRRLLGF